MQLPDVEHMSSAEKNWFASSIAGMIVADGRADQTELEFLKEAINFLDNKDEISQIMAIVKSGTLPELSPLEIDSKQAFLMLKYLAQLMVADSDLSSKEIEFFLVTGKFLGFSDEILSKFWKSARSLLERDLPQGMIETGKLKVKVILTNVDESGFTFRLTKPLMPKVKIRLRVSKIHQSQEPTDREEEYWNVIVCKMLNQRQLKYDGGCYMVRSTFEQKIAFEHGVLQILDPENYAVVSKGGYIETKKNSLHGSRLHCYICDNPEVPFYVLQSKSMKTKSNIFGIPTYLSSAGELDFCNYNLIDVASCSKCGFSSNHKEDFKRLETDNPHFDCEKFSKEWSEKITPFLKKAQDLGEKYFGEERDVEEGILSYDLAAATFEHLANIETDVRNKREAIRRKVSMLMVQSELLMENEDRENAEANLKKVVEDLETIFESLEAPVILHVCVLLFQIKIYFNDLQSAAQYMKFMDNYDTEGKLQEGTEEYKELKVNSAKIKATFDDREILTKENLKHFHLDDDE